VVAQRQRCLPLSLIYARAWGERDGQRLAGGVVARHTRRVGPTGAHRSLAPSDASVDRSGGAPYHSHSPRPRPGRRRAYNVHSTHRLQTFPRLPVGNSSRARSKHQATRLAGPLSLFTWTILQTITLCSVAFSYFRMFPSKNFRCASHVYDRSFPYIVYNRVW